MKKRKKEKKALKQRDDLHTTGRDWPTKPSRRKTSHWRSEGVGSTCCTFRVRVEESEVMRVKMVAGQAGANQGNHCTQQEPK